MTKKGNLFVYALCGDHHVGLVNTSLRFLKNFTRQEIVVLASRCESEIQHDQVQRHEVPSQLDNHQASIMLKTNVHRLVGSLAHRCFYLDTDVIAVDSEIDMIFGMKCGPVSFAPDISRMRAFSRWAVRCSCLHEPCDHLRDRIRGKFGVEVSDPDWQHWNGGVFLFDSESVDFMDTWHRYTTSILLDPHWKTRDQGTLIATAWKFQLQNQPTLPTAYNYIVNAMRGIEMSKRATAPISEYFVNVSYSFDPNSTLTHPRFLHFINGGVGARGWRNWDDAEARLASSSNQHAEENLQS